MRFRPLYMLRRRCPTRAREACGPRRSGRRPESEKTKRIAAVFSRAQVPSRISEIQGELWTKLVWNCALNAVFPRWAARSTAKSPPAPMPGKLWKTAVHEVLAVARAAGIHPPGLEDPKVALAGALKIATQMARRFPRPDKTLNRGKRTEIDSLNGYISAVARSWGSLLL